MARSLFLFFGLLLLTAAGCQYESPTHFEERFPLKGGELKFITPDEHSRNQVIKITTDTGNLPMDLCVVPFDMQSKYWEAARDEFKNGEEPINKLASVFREPNPKLSFKVPAKSRVTVMIRNASDRTKEVYLKISGQ